MKRFDESVRARVMGEGLCIRGWWWGLLCCEEVRGIMNRFDESVRACCVCFFLCCVVGWGMGGGLLLDCVQTVADPAHVHDTHE